jgi:hypothetical protein
VHLGLGPSYAWLCLLQGAVALAPGRTRRLGSSAVFGILLPAGALALGVAIVRVGTGGADFLAALATAAAPLLSGALGPLRGWRYGWWTVPAAAGLYAVAWFAPHGDLGTQAAGALLVAGACLALATGIRALAGERWIAVGLVGLVCLDVILVWITPQVGPTTTTLHAAAPPAPPVPVHVLHTHPLPRLQDVTFGSALMGWLDLLAPALLGTIVRHRAAAAAALTVAALLFGLLLYVTDPIPATVPVLVGLGVDYALRRRSRSSGVAMEDPAPA